MRRANLGNMFALLWASGWINQLLAKTLLPTTDAKIGKVFHEPCQPAQGDREHNHFSVALRCPAVAVAPHESVPCRAFPIYVKRSNIRSTLEVSPSRDVQLQVLVDGLPDIIWEGDRSFAPTFDLHPRRPTPMAPDDGGDAQIFHLAHTRTCSRKGL
jgi:hypothetical protein